jgi:hypothetical protein
MLGPSDHEEHPMAGLTEAEVRAIIDTMTQDRGFIINSFAQVECLLADLIDQCRSQEAYEDLSGKPIPFGADNRVARVRELAKSGPLAPHAERLGALLDRFMEFENVRHLFTHGFASFAHTPDGDAGMFFVRYVPPPKGGEVTMVREFYRPQTMRAQRDSCVTFIEGAMQAFREVYVAAELNPDRLATHEPV